MSQTGEKKEGKKPGRDATLRYAKFAADYVLHGNASKAAKDAGYSPKSADQQAHELLKKPVVQALISDARREAAEKLKMNSQEVLQRLAAIARGNLKDVATWGAKEVTKRSIQEGTEHTEMVNFLEVKDSSELTEWQAYAIESVKLTDGEWGNTLTVKMRNPSSALEKLVEILKMIGAGDEDETKELKAAMEQLDREEREKVAARKAARAAAEKAPKKTT